MDSHKFNFILEVAREGMNRSDVPKSMGWTIPDALVLRRLDVDIPVVLLLLNVNKLPKLPALSCRGVGVVAVDGKKNCRGA